MLLFFKRKIFFLRTATFVLFLLISINEIEAQDDYYEPLRLDSTEYIVYKPDLRLNPGREYTLELQLRFPKKFKDTSENYQIVRYGVRGSYIDYYKVSISGNRKEIRFSNGSVSFKWSCNFSDGNFHQIVIINNGLNANLAFDAKPVPGGVHRSLPANLINKASNYDDAEDFFNSELQFANNGDDDFLMELRTFRIWRSRISDLNRWRQLSEFYGAPEDEQIGLFKDLQAYSYFTVNATAFFYTSPQYFATEYAGASEGNYSFFSNVNMDDLNKAFQKVDGIKSIKLPANEKIKRVFGTHNGENITSLSLVTNKNTIVWLDNRNANDIIQAFCIDVPDYADFSGFITRGDSANLRSLGLTYSYQMPKDDHLVLNRLATSEKWVSEDDEAPQRMSMGADILHGNYSNVPIYTIKKIIPDSLYAIFKDFGPDSTMQMVMIRRKSNSKFRTYWPGVSSNGGISTAANISGNKKMNDLLKVFSSVGTVLFTEDKILTNNLVSMNPNASHSYIDTFSQSLVQPKDYSLPYDDKISWGGTFSQDHRPPMSRANFVGYDIFKMDPKDLQKDVYAQSLVFKYPEENSYNYYTTDNKTIVPFGLLYRNDNVGHEKTKAKTYSSESKYAESWGFNVGISAGIPEICKFSENVKYKSTIEHMSSNSYEITTAKTVIGKYSLVLDRAKVELSDGFRADVIAMRNALLNQMKPDYTGFMNKYGTHYPYAVTYGGMAFLEGMENETKTGYANQSSVDMETKASGALEGISIGGSLGFNYGTSYSYNTDNSIKVLDFGTVGGSLTSSNGFSVSKGEEVPIFLDLRPIYELFSPTFFDDDKIWTTLRNGFQQELAARAKNASLVMTQIIQQNPLNNKPLKMTFLDQMTNSGNNHSAYSLYYDDNKNLSKPDARVDITGNVTVPVGVRKILITVTLTGRDITKPLGTYLLKRKDFPNNTVYVIAGPENSNVPLGKYLWSCSPTFN